MCIRKSKEETAEVWPQHTHQSTVVCLALDVLTLCVQEKLNVEIDVLKNALKDTWGTATSCGHQDNISLTGWFPPVYDVFVYVSQSGQDYSWTSWKPSRSPLCSSRGWWPWQSRPSPTSEGFFRRMPTDPDIWKVNTDEHKQEKNAHLRLCKPSK